MSLDKKSLLDLVINKGPVTRKMFPFDDVIMFVRQPGDLNSKGFNAWRPRQNGRHIPDHIFKYIFLNENI